MGKFVDILSSLTVGRREERVLYFWNGGNFSFPWILEEIFCPHERSMYTNSVRSTISIFAVKKKLQLTTQRECNLQRQLLGFCEGIFHSSALQPRKPRYRSMTIVSVATRRIYPDWWCATLPGDEVKWHLLAKICSKKNAVAHNYTTHLFYACSPSEMFLFCQ